MHARSPAELNECSRRVRDARTRVRRALATGELTIADAMRNPPTELGEHTLFEVLLMARNVGRQRLRALNRRAIADDINLALTLNSASQRTREWIATNTLRTAPASVWARVMED